MWIKALRLASVIIAAGMSAVFMGAESTAAATIEGFTAPPITAAGWPLNISTGAQDWVYYGYNGRITGMNTAAGNSAQFSSLLGRILGCWVRGYSVYLKFPGAKTPGTSFVFENGPYTANGGGGGRKANRLSFTSRLIAPSETLTIFLTSFDCKSKISVALLAAGNSSPIAQYSDTTVLSCNSNPDNDGSGPGTGVLTLRIQGGHQGDLLKFTDQPVLAGVDDTQFNNVGIQAASVAIPVANAAKLPPMMTPAQAADDPAVTAGVDTLLQKLTVAEKIELLSGLPGPPYMFTHPIPRRGIPAVVMSDGRVGVHDWGADTLFPATVALVSTWNKKLCYREGVAMGRDARSRGIDMILSPLVNLYREPQDGRNFEYMGEDPFLASEVAVNYIRGIQSQHVAADVTDFCAYEQEADRRMIDSIVSHRALEELYFPPFKAAVQKAGVWTLMSSYNRLNGEWCSANRYLLTGILRHRWHFKGLIVCDWGLSSHVSTLRALRAGLNLEMPCAGHYTLAHIRPLIRSGDFRVARLNELVTPLLRMIVAMDLMKYPQRDVSIALHDPYSDHVAYEIEKQGAVLLKNRDHILPLSTRTDHLIIVVGPNSRSVAPGGGSPFEGGGSSYGVPIVKPISMMEAVKKMAPAGTRVIYLKSLTGKNDRALLRQADAVIACIGWNSNLEGEGLDHPYALPASQYTLMAHVTRLNSHVVVILNGGGNVAMRPWIHQVPGLIEAWYPGQSGNLAVASILFGKINPSGRLPETFGKRWKDAPAYGHYPGHDNTVHFAEGIYLGYRWFNKKKITPRYPFGFGLSYTTFVMHHLRISSRGGGKQRMFNVMAEITNTGSIPGAEVAQLYVHPLVDRRNRCVQTLKGFVRVNLQPGQTKTIAMKLYWHDFAYYDTAAKAWRVPHGIYEITVGSSSANEPLHKIVHWK